MQRSKISREEMYSHIRAWQSLGVSQKQYCRSQNITYYLFHYWYRKFKEEQGGTPEGFIQLPSPVSSTLPFAEITFPSGRRILLHQPVSADYLKSLAG